MSTNIRSALRKWVPPWMSPTAGKDNGFKLVYAPALVADLSLEALTQGVQAKYPGVGTPTALPYIGRDRQIKRGFAETDEAYAARLLVWRDSWRRAGSAWAIMDQVLGYVFPTVPRMRVINNNGTFYTRETDGTHIVEDVDDWDWDSNSGGDPALNSRVWLVIYSNAGPWTTDGTWGDGEDWGGTPDETWGSTATPDQVASIQALVDEWKAAHDLCVTIVVAFDSALFDPTDNATYPTDGLWGHWSKNVAGVQVPARDPGAIYWDC